jgi:hypothetical protein
VLRDLGFGDVAYYQRLEEEKLRKRAQETLGHMAMLFKDERELRRRYSVRPERDGDGKMKAGLGDVGAWTETEWLGH